MIVNMLGFLLEEARKTDFIGNVQIIPGDPPFYSKSLTWSQDSRRVASIISIVPSIEVRAARTAPVRMTLASFLNLIGIELPTCEGLSPSCKHTRA